MQIKYPVTGFRKTRLAPTPSGYLHLGNAFSFALTASIAAMTGASLLLRIDDLDQARVRPEYITDIFETMDFLNLQWREGPVNQEALAGRYSQLHRMPLYLNALDKLRSSGQLFACTCTRSNQDTGKGYSGNCRNKNISLDMPGVCWRIRTDSRLAVTMRGFTGGESRSFLPASLTDFVVRKKDGFPSYQLSSLVDDVFFGVDLIVRGTDLLPSSLAQLFLAGQLNYERFLSATFFFHRLIADEHGKKLSKSDGDISIASMIARGATAEEIYRVMGQLIGMEETLTSFLPLAKFVIDRSGLT